MPEEIKYAGINTLTHLKNFNDETYAPKKHLHTTQDIEDYVAPAQADWNENDESAIDYIKNRPFYEAGSVETVVLTETDITIYKAYYAMHMLSNELLFEDGATYKVIFDGVTYECVAFKHTDSNIVIGNPYIPNGSMSSGKEPFFVNGSYVYSNKKGNHTISIVLLSEEIVPLSEKFIPDTIARTEYVDENFALKSDLQAIDLSKYLTKVEADDVYQSESEAYAQFNHLANYSDSNLATAKSYTDGKISELLDGATDETLNSIKELADAIKENDSVIDALNDIAAGKANATHGHAIADVSGLQNALDDKYKTTSKEKEATWDGSSKVPVDYNNVTYYKLVQGTYEDLLNGFTYSVTLTDGTTKTQTVTSDEANNYIALDENGYYIICEGLFIIAPDVTGILLNPSLMTSVESFCFTARKTYLDSKYLSAPIASYDNLGESVIEGDLNSNVASGEYAHAGGEQTTASGTRAFAHGFQTKASNMGATTFGYQSEACGIASFAAGRSAKAIGNYSIALGLGAIAKGNNAYAAGYSHKSQDYNLTIEELLTIFETAFANDNAKGLFNAALGTNSVSMGKSNVAYGNAASAFGAYNRAKGGSSFACGCGTNAGGDYSFAGGYYTKAIDNQFAVGHYNDDSIAEKGTNSGIGTGTAFVIGNGTSDAKSNAFRVTYEGQPYAKMALTTTGCDYAEFFEWIDGNLEKEDRRGYFVTTDGEKIKKAEPGDYILGITSALPSVIGNGDECWKGRYILDKFGDFIVEEAEMEVLELDRETGEYAKVTKMIKKWKENPEYNPEEQYIHRKERPEWSTVGMLGVIAVRDDGTCKVNGFCEVSEGGIATTASTGYRVAARVADNVIKVIFR